MIPGLLLYLLATYFFTVEVVHGLLTDPYFVSRFGDLRQT